MKNIDSDTVTVVTVIASQAVIASADPKQINKVYHTADCSDIKRIKHTIIFADAKTAEDAGYSPADRCNVFQPSPTASRDCARCHCQLRKDNPGPLCSPCKGKVPY